MSSPSLLMRSDSVYPDSVYPDSVYHTKYYSSDDEDEDNYDGRSNCSEVLAGEEEETRAQQDAFRQKQRKADKEGYKQVMQITVENIKSALTCSGNGLISIEKSLSNSELYIYMPITSAVYTVPMDPTSTFQSLLDYILYTTPEFVDFGKGRTFDFVLNGFKSQEDNIYIENPTAVATATFLSLPLTKIPLSQGTIRLVV